MGREPSARLLFIHFLMAVALLAAVTLQAASVLTSVRQVAGNFIDRFSPVPAASYATVIVILYMPQALLGGVDVSQVPALRQNSYGRPAHVLVWLDPKCCHRRARAGLDRSDYFRSVASPGDRFLLHPGCVLAERPRCTENLHY